MGKGIGITAFAAVEVVVGSKGAGQLAPGRSTNNTTSGGDTGGGTNNGPDTNTDPNNPANGSANAPNTDAEAGGSSRSSPDPYHPTSLIDPDRVDHILYGEQLPNGSWSGGHLWPGKPGKTPFPQSWDANKILAVASNIATDPSLIPRYTRGAPGSLVTKTGKPSRYYVEKKVDGVTIRVVVEPASGKIITAFPTS